MKQKFSVVIVAGNSIQGEVYEFGTLKEAQEFAKARKELYEMIHGAHSFVDRLLQPRIIISPLCKLEKRKKRQRNNEINERMTGDIQRRMEKAYMRQIRRKNSRQDMDIIKCYEQAGLVHSLYSCLVEEDDERLRESVQTLADNILNDEVMPTLTNIGYVF